jgi:two pore calcium channel protein, plant
LDRDGTSTITEDEFMDLGTVFALEFASTTDYATFVERRFPRLYISSYWQGFCGVVRSAYFDMGVDAILVLNAIVVAIQSYPELAGNDTNISSTYAYWYGSVDTVWERMETIFTVVYCVEVATKLLVFGWRAYREESRNMFDLLITILAVLSSLYVYYPNGFDDSRVIRLIVMARVLRLMRLLAILPSLRVICLVSEEIFPAARSFAMMLFMLMYFYAALGVALYGGIITRDPKNPRSYDLLNTDFSDNEYWANNLNDMVSGINVLFNLLVVNNWTEVSSQSKVAQPPRITFTHLWFYTLLGQAESGFEAASQSKWVRFYLYVSPLVAFAASASEQCPKLNAGFCCSLRQAFRFTS